MKVLIIGNGGREHALAWKAIQSPDVSEVLVAPGNAGTAIEPGVRNVDTGSTSIPELITLAKKENVSLTIVGPEVPLVSGIVDQFNAAGLRCFGPCSEAAKLEGSKAYMKEFLRANQIPTAGYEVYTAIEPAKERIRERGVPIVIKADGLAAGKGVIVAQTIAEADAAVSDMLAAGRFGNAGKRVVIEDFLAGEEASFIAMVDGETVLPLASSQDHKRRDDGDLGPNTGGMGAYTPAPVIDSVMHDRIMNEIMLPTVRALNKAGTPYVGFLYAGVMIAEDKTPRVLEFNCRLGDPETQPILMRLQSDLVALCNKAIDGDLAGVEVQWDPRAALGVVLASGGYPETYEVGDTINGLADDIADTKVFHAGTRPDGEHIVTAGGRVLCVVGLGDTVGAAQRLAYHRAEKIDWNNLYYRRDIGHRAINRP